MTRKIRQPYANSYSRGMTKYPVQNEATFRRLVCIFSSAIFDFEKTVLSPSSEKIENKYKTEVYFQAETDQYTKIQKFSVQGEK